MKEALIHELGYFAELFGDKAKEAAEASQRQDEKGREDISAPCGLGQWRFLTQKRQSKKK